MVCPHCARYIEDAAEKCEYCGLAIGENTLEQKVRKEVKHNFWLGLLGAIIGCLLGGGLILLASKLAGLGGTLTGMALSALVLNGYRLLGRKLPRIGVMASMALVAITVFLVDRVDWCFRIIEWYNEQAMIAGTAQIDFWGTALNFNLFLNMGVVDLTAYLTNLIFLYVFSAVGFIGTIRTIYKKHPHLAK